MHSLEGIRALNDRRTIQGTRQKLVGMELFNAETRTQSTDRTFVTIDSAKRFVEANGGEFAGVSSRK